MAAMAAVRDKSLNLDNHLLQPLACVEKQFLDEAVPLSSAFQGVLT